MLNEVIQKLFHLLSRITKTDKKKEIDDMQSMVQKRLSGILSGTSYQAERVVYQKRPKPDLSRLSSQVCEE